MSDDALAESPVFLGARAAGWFAVLVLIAFGGVIAFSVLDHPKAAALERFSQSTAVGDVHFYTPPVPPLAVPEPVLTWEGRAWAPASWEKVKIDDPEMRRAGTDETTGFSLYEPRTGKPAGRFIKIAIGEYLPLVAR